MTPCSDGRKETDAQLVARMREGDTSAFELIVERYRAALIARAHAQLGSFADAEDVAQDAFVQAYLHLHELRDPEALLPWLRRVAERLSLTRIRGNRETPLAPEDIEIVAEAQRDGVKKDTLAVESLLGQLPETMREAVSLTFLAGYTCAEAAHVIGVREGTIKSRLNRARAKLKEALTMTERDIAGGRPSGEFTRRTIERLKREAQRLLAKGDVNEARKRAEAVLNEQVKPLFGDPQELGLARTMLAAFDSAAFKPDEEAVGMLGLPRKKQRRKECEANAAQYGFRLADLDWELADVDTMTETLAKPTGNGKDTWGVPVSRLKLEIVDARALCQRLRVSPLTLYGWVRDGCPILRCWPFARFDAECVQTWLAERDISEWQAESEYDLERPIRIIFRAVYEGLISAEHAEEVIRYLGYGVWSAPMPWLKGGW
ncbi:MAG: RNA polymerase sigma factor [Armatimonadota bacterium]|nr:RNA polymerase sigma factor [Armatimonadota bacterium]